MLFRAKVCRAINGLFSRDKAMQNIVAFSQVVKKLFIHVSNKQVPIDGFVFK